jgi:hypothetical protein
MEFREKLKNGLARELSITDGLKQRLNPESVPESSSPGKNHADAMPVGRFYYLFIAHRASRLNNGLYTSGSQGLYPIGKRKKSI